MGHLDASLVHAGRRSAVVSDQDDDFIISKRIVELHGGKLWADTETGGVPTIRFALPIPQQLQIAQE